MEELSSFSLRDPVGLSLTLYPFGLLLVLCSVPALVCAAVGMKRR